MVTNMNKTARNGATVSNSNEAEKAANATQTAFLKIGNEKVATAIKSRNESFGDLRSAAAYAVYALVDFGHTELLNKLFNKLPTIDADAIRQKFVVKVIDLFGAGGTWNEAESKWEVRPTAFISFLQTPTDGNKDQHFRVAKGNDSEAGKAKQALITAGRDAVRAAGVEALEAIDWLSRAGLMAKTSVYDVLAFHGNIQKELVKAAKASVNPEAKISPAEIRAAMRALNFAQSESAVVELALLQASTPSAKPETKTESEPETTLIKTDEKQAA